MYLRTSYTDVQGLYPEAVDDVMRGLRSSKSKHRDCAAEELGWTYSSSLRVEAPAREWEGEDAPQKAPRKTPLKAPTAAQRLKDLISRTTVVLMGKKDKGAQYCSSPLRQVPEAIIAQYRRMIEDDQREERRVAALSPEERRREIAEAVRLLGRSSGFIQTNLDMKAKQLSEDSASRFVK